MHMHTRNRTHPVTVMMKFCDDINSPFKGFPHNAVCTVHGATKVVPAKSARLVSTLYCCLLQFYVHVPVCVCVGVCGCVCVFMFVHTSVVPSYSLTLPPKNMSVK